MTRLLESVLPGACREVSSPKKPTIESTEIGDGPVPLRHPRTLRMARVVDPLGPHRRRHVGRCAVRTLASRPFSPVTPPPWPVITQEKRRVEREGKMVDPRFLYGSSLRSRNGPRELACQRATCTLVFFLLSFFIFLFPEYSSSIFVQCELKVESLIRSTFLGAEFTSLVCANVLLQLQYTLLGSCCPAFLNIKKLRPPLS